MDRSGKGKQKGIEMTRLEQVIEDVKERRKGKGAAWIFDDNGNIREDVIVGDILPLLKELKEYEINVTDGWIDRFKRNHPNFYTYNWNANVSNDFAGWYTTESPCIMVLNVHLGGDARVVWDTDFVIKVDSLEAFWSLEEMTQPKDVNDRYVADIDLISESYYVYDTETGETIGPFCEMERDDLLREIERSV